MGFWGIDYERKDANIALVVVVVVIVHETLVAFAAYVNLKGWKILWLLQQMLRIPL